jgi:hypothetical protein
MTRKLSDWNIFVKKIYAEGKAKNSDFEFKDALVEASKRKSEMKHSSASGVKSKTSKKRSKTALASMAGRKKVISKTISRNASMSASVAGGKTRRRRRH